MIKTDWAFRLHCRSGKRQEPGYLSPLAISCLCSFVLVVASCGGKKRQPPIPIPTTARAASVSKLPQKGTAPAIRVLLKENFQRARIEGSALGPSLRAEVEGDAIKLVGGQKHRSGSGFRLEPDSKNLIYLDGRPYRGAVEVFINPVDRPVIVNEIGLEDYVKGVVANELDPEAFPQIEAIRAQAVAARTYAFSTKGEHSSLGFDLYSDQRSQVYRGVGSEHTLSNRAVEETHGLMAVYQGKPILAFYSSACGGKTADCQFVLQHNSLPYLRGGVRCEEAPNRYSLWDEKIPVSRIQESLDRRADVGRLRKLVPLNYGLSGRIAQMLFVGDKGKKVLKGSEIRFVLGLRSSFILNLVPSYDRLGNIAEVHVRGRGYGHGVGLCQMGSVELAKRGLTFKQILKRYYLGIDLGRHY